MAETLPEPKSRKESYLAKAAGMSVSVPEAPESREEQYLAAIADGGGGGGTTYTAGDGIDITNNEISVDTTTIQEKLTAGTGINITDNTISATGGGSSYNVYSTVTTSSSNRGGAIYLGNLNASQEQFADPTTPDAHARYIHMLPYSNTTKPASNSIILGSELTNSSASGGIGLGFNASVEASGVVNIGGAYGKGENSVIIGRSASNQRSGTHNVLIGYSSIISEGSPDGTVGLGAYSRPTRTGEVNIGSTNTSFGFNNTNYRLVSGVHDPLDAHDVATKGYVDASGRVLTSADYNWPENNPDGFALWKFPQGQYFFPAGAAIYYDSDNTTSPMSATDNQHGGTFTVACSYGDTFKYTITDDSHCGLGIDALPSGESAGFFEFQIS